MAVARSFSGGVAIRYVLPFCRRRDVSHNGLNVDTVYSDAAAVASCAD